MNPSIQPGDYVRHNITGRFGLVTATSPQEIYVLTVRHRLPTRWPLYQVTHIKDAKK